MANNSERCDVCRYWEKDANNYSYNTGSAAATSQNSYGDVGVCRRHAPVVVALYNNPTEVTRFPRISANGWCGEYQPPLTTTELQNLHQWAEKGAI